MQQYILQFTAKSLKCHTLFLHAIYGIKTVKLDQLSILNKIRNSVLSPRILLHHRMECVLVLLTYINSVKIYTRTEVQYDHVLIKFTNCS